MQGLAVLLVLLLTGASCQRQPATPEQQVQALYEAWVEAEPPLAETGLEKRYRVALDYLRTHAYDPNKHWIAKLDAKEPCTFPVADSVLSQPRPLRVAVRPNVLTSELAGELTARWACQVYGLPTDSLREGYSSDARFSLVATAADRAAETVYRRDFRLPWERGGRSGEGTAPFPEQVAAVLERLPSWEEGPVVVFGLPEGHTITADLYRYHELSPERWGILREQPVQVNMEVGSAVQAVFVFDGEDEIVDVWWGRWIR